MGKRTSLLFILQLFFSLFIISGMSFFSKTFHLGTTIGRNVNPRHRILKFAAASSTTRKFSTTLEHKTDSYGKFSHSQYFSQSVHIRFSYMSYISMIFISGIL
jgi:hypothetical protein